MSKIDTIIQAMQGPIVEIGGPTPGGYKFLKDSTATLPVAPIITNIVRVVMHNPFGKEPIEFEVDEVVNVKDMPYVDNTVGSFIACTEHHCEGSLSRRGNRIQLEVEPQEQAGDHLVYPWSW